MRVLGIDPGLGCTGYGVIDTGRARLMVLEAGVIRSPARHTLADRLRHVHAAVVDLLQRYKPQALALEELYSHYQHPRTAIVMGHVRGVICLAAAQEGVPLTGYAARRVKQVLTGSGAAAKAQMQQAVQQTLRLKTALSPHDVADALALAITHIHIKRSRL